MSGRFTDEKYQFGIEQEKLKFPTMKKIFGNDVRMTATKARVDFYSSTKLIEMKSRTCASYRYDTTWITTDKGQHNTTKEIYFVFNFTDKLMYIKFDRDLFSTYKHSLNEWGKDNWDIPINDLTFIENNDRELQRGVCLL